MRATQTISRLTIVALLSFGLASALSTPAGAQQGCSAPAGYNLIESNDRVIRGTEGPDFICGGAGPNTIFGLGGDDIILGGAGADTLWGGNGIDELRGGPGPDIVRGGFAGDLLYGDTGNDRLFGGPGPDFLDGGAHQDVLTGGRGDDLVVGGTGFDRLLGGDGSDRLRGEEGADYLAGGKGKDVLSGGPGNDVMFGGTSHDELTGGDGDDQLTGGDGFDELSGDDGDDRLRGGNGDDKLRGGDGNDALNGGLHVDRAVGGTGIDTCVNAEMVRDCANVADNIRTAETDFGVTEETIRLGLTVDLSGPFSGLSSVIVEAQQAYFERVNETGGIDGREVELIILDSAYDVPTQLDNYAELSEQSADGVVMISHSTGSPHTAAIAGDLQDDNLVAVPLSWYSGWSTDFGSNVFELHSNYCFEAMNGVEALVELSGLNKPKLAIVSRPGEYGQDGAAGARIAAETLGLEVLDLEASIAGDDFTPIVSTLVAEQPDIVWITSSPGELAQIFGGSAAGGLTALWSGNSPSYNVVLLDTPVGPALDAFYFHSTYNALWGANRSRGMRDMQREILTRVPFANYAQADSFVIGWTEAMFAEAVLERAADNGDLTRAGVLAAANGVTVDFEGLAPNQTWNGTPNDTVVRATYLYDVVLADATLTTNITTPGSTGLEIVKENFVGSVARGHDFTEPCFISE